MWDERLSSEGAFKLSANTGVNTSKKIEKLDQNAASFILQGVLDYLKR
jgi:putative Holliday junction resolvase